MIVGALVKALKATAPSHLAVAAALLCVSSAVGFAVTQPEEPVQPSGATTMDLAQLDLSAFAADAQGIIDSDGDGAPDGAENLVHGSDPFDWNTSGSGIPDGWLVRYGHDPLDPGAATARAAAPPADALPPTWQARFVPTLMQVYSHGRPSDWSEADQGAFDSGLDPRVWDTSGDGIPDGWLLAYGLDPRQSWADERLPSGSLSVMESFLHGTDPRQQDTDGDGLTDREEIDGPRAPSGVAFAPTDPAAASTSGTGVCDGYLVAHGLDPHLSANALGDLDRDGATTRQEYEWSVAAFPDQACHGKGLDPTAQVSGTAGLPDGWLIRHGLDPLQAGIQDQVTQDTATETRLPGIPAPAQSVKLTVAQEYGFGRPPDWSEAQQGPWMGGTDPMSLDTDGDGLSDAWELGGYALSVIAQPGQLEPTTYVARLDPTRNDTDADGLLDFDEVMQGSDGTRADTDFDGLLDSFEAGHAYLDPLDADSAGDLLRDGVRYKLLTDAAQRYAKSDAYTCTGSCLYSNVLQWLTKVPGANGAVLDPTSVAALVGPEGNINGRLDSAGQPVPNIIDPDIDGDEIKNGAEIDPRLYAGTLFGTGPLGHRAASDPLNPDTDGDGLPDGWEVEHGLPRDGRYHLDPADWDSDGDGLADGREDDDADGTTWMDYATDPRGIPVEEPFDNLREFQFGTDPNDAFSDGDGLRDGWKVFWALLYPRLDEVPASAARPKPGDPQPAHDEASLIAAHPYWRYAVNQETSLVTARGESFRGTTVSASGLALRNVTGVWEWRFHDAQRLGTNPYVADTDGDGMPDWWEAAHAVLPPGLVGAVAQCLNVPAPDPLRPDAATDHDADGLDAGQEHARNGNPRCKDTDMAGVPDGTEKLHGLNPGDPADDIGLQDQAIDSDKDGVSDFVEITETFTDPRRPDTDGDGMLDGGTITGDGCLTKQSPFAIGLLDLGIAYERVNGCLRFLGERDTRFKYDPLDADDHGIGVPAGWLQMKMPSFSNTADDRRIAQEHYALGKPAWWQESAHGPWWGGADPASNTQFRNLAVSKDLDGDGLLDRDDAGQPAEDLFPAANPENQPRVGDATVDPRDATADVTTRRLAAQGMVNPAPYAGNDRNNVEHPVHDPGTDTRDPTCLQIDQAPDTVAKGRMHAVTGRLRLLHCDGPGVAGVAVQATLAGQPFGVHFTDAQGAFRIELNVSSSQRTATVPPGPGSVWRGVAAGPVSWTPDASAVATGGQKMVLQTYANGDVQRTAVAHDVTVTASSAISITAPPVARVQQAIPVQITLRDSAGQPLSHALQITWNGVSLPDALPGAGDGTAQVSLPSVSPAQAGTVRLDVTSRPPAGAVVSGASGHVDIDVKRPSLIELEPPGTVVAGGLLRVEGRLASIFGAASRPGEPGQTVVVDLVAGGRVVETASSTTGSDGSFAAPLTVPADLSSGTYALRARFAGSPAVDAASGGASIQVRAVPRFDAVSRAGLDAQGPHHVRGLLTGPDGAIPSRPVRVWLGNAQTVATTAENGTFHAVFDATLPPGPVLQRVVHDAGGGYAAAEAQIERFVVASTSLTGAAGTVARGAELHMPLHLKDAQGQGIAGAKIRVAWGEEAPTEVLTDATGQAVYKRPSEANGRLGPVLVRAVYAGDPGGGRAASQLTMTWSVQAQVRFEWPLHVVAGSDAGHARLVDAGTGQGLPDRAIELVMGAEPARHLKTGADGRFPLLSPVPASDASPRAFRAIATFPGDHEYPAASNATRVTLVSPVAMTVLAPERVVAGRAFTIDVRLVDGQGNTPRDAAIEAVSQGAALAQAPSQAGSLTVTLDRAVESFLVRFHDSPWHAEAEQTVHVRVLEPARLEVVKEPSREPGHSVVYVKLTAGAQPVEGRSVFLFVEGVGAGLHAMTGADGRATFHVRQGNEALAFIARAPGGDAVAAAAAAGLLDNPATMRVVEPSAPVWPWLAVAGAALLVVGFFVARRLRRVPLAAAFYRARRVIDARDVNQKTVLEAYSILEDAAIALELLSAPANTPRGLQRAVEPAVPPPFHGALETLIALFEMARYSADRMTPSHMRDARRCLAALHRGLERSQGGAA